MAIQSAHRRTGARARRFNGYRKQRPNHCISGWRPDTDLRTDHNRLLLTPKAVIHGISGMNMGLLAAIQLAMRSNRRKR